MINTIPRDLDRDNRHGDLYGYRRLPRHREIQIDREHCDTATCRHCGAYSLGCRQYENTLSGAYRIYSICHRCGAQESI